MSNSPSTFGDSNEFPEAEAWKPAPGDAMFMEIGSLDEYKSDYSDEPTIVYEGIVLSGEASTQDGKVIEPGTETRVFLFGAFLSRDAKKNQLGPGDKVAFKRYEDAAEATKPGYAPAKRYKTKVLSRVTAAPAAPVEEAAAEAKTYAEVQAEERDGAPLRTQVRHVQTPVTEATPITPNGPGHVPAVPVDKEPSF